MELSYLFGYIYCDYLVYLIVPNKEERDFVQGRGSGLWLIKKGNTQTS
jgi:hypothetical protein